MIYVCHFVIIGIFQGFAGFENSDTELSWTDLFIYIPLTWEFLEQDLVKFDMILESME